MRDEELQKLYQLVNKTAVAMRKRLKQKYTEGYRGWEWDATTVRERLRGSLRKNKWIDVCNLAAMLHHMKEE